MDDDRASRVVTIEILGRSYPIRSTLEAAYVTELAAYVDHKMQAVADRLSGSDAVKIAVLAALNIADEYFRCRDAGEAVSGSLRRRTEELEAMVNEALGVDIR